MYCTMIRENFPSMLKMMEDIIKILYVCDGEGGSMEEKQARLKKFPENTVIVKEGEIQTEMYKILSGKVAVYINYGEKNEYLLGVLSEQKCFGETCILCKKPSPYTIIAVYDVLAMRISEDEFDDFVQNNTKNATDIIKNLAREVVNLRWNLDMVIDELENGSEPEKYKVQELKQKMQPPTVSDPQ